LITEEETKSDPLTLSVNAGPPAVLLLGDIARIFSGFGTAEV
jgi:hypothetical protein